MPEKPRKITRQYACWRGTTEQLVEIAEGLKLEILRAAEAAKQQAYREIDETIRQNRERYIMELRKRDGVAGNAPLSQALMIELAQSDQNAKVTADQQKKFQRDFIDNQASKPSFGYTDANGQFRSSNNPTFLKTAMQPVGITMQANLFGTAPSAGIIVTIQNKPWESVSLDVSGDDPDWVSSTFAMIHDMLLRRESKVVGFLRNQWVRNVVGLGLWLLFIPSFENLFKTLRVDILFSIPASLISAGLIATLFQFLTKPFGITAREPSALLDILKAAWPPVAGAVASFLLRRF